MTRALVATVKPGAVTDAQPLHRMREVGFGQFHHQVIVVLHEHISVKVQPESGDCLGEQLAEVATVRIIKINGFTFIAPGSEMVPAARSFDAQRSGHGRRFIGCSSGYKPNVECKDVTPFVPGRSPFVPAVRPRSKIALVVIHALVVCFAGYWCFTLATKGVYPHSRLTVEQWREWVTQITNVTELHQKSVEAHDYRLLIESLLDTLRWIAAVLAGVLTFYALAGVVRNVRREN